MTLDFIGGMLLTSGIMLNAFAFITALAAPRFVKLGLAATAGLWTGLQISLDNAGLFTGSLSQTVPLIGVMVALPPLVVLLAAALSPAVRAALLALPPQLLIGLNTLRIVGFFFLLLAVADRLGGPFPVSAGWGDIITGALAAPLAVMVAQGSANRTTVLAWNAFGMLDLIVAVALGTLSSNGFAFQLIEAGPGSAAVQAMPWVLIPSVLVPFYLITHGILFAQLRRAAVGSSQPA